MSVNVKDFKTKQKNYPPKSNKKEAKNQQELNSQLTNYIRKSKEEADERRNALQSLSPKVSRTEITNNCVFPEI